MANDNQENRGVLFRNDRRTTDKHPNSRGEGNIVCPACGAVTELWLSAWTRVSKKGDKYLALTFKPKEEEDARQSSGKRPNAADLAQGTPIDDEDVPF
jgi:hypothetical protein